MQKTFAVVSTIVLAATVYAGARNIGPVPPLGRILDPVHGAWSMARTSDPPSDARARIPGLKAAVNVSFDGHGVPHIFAANEMDAYRALGYVVARDRLFQLELQARAGAGTLTELVGKAALESDEQTRSLGMPHAAEQKLAAIDPTSPSRALMDAYAAGVNAYIDALSPADYPIEYKLLGKRPARWAPDQHDAPAEQNGIHARIVRARALARARRGARRCGRGERAVSRAQPHRRTDPARARLDLRARSLRRDPAAIGARHERDHARRWFSIARAGEISSILNGRPRSRATTGLWPRGASRSGHALLAGDPHLDLTLPSIWYEAHIVVPGVVDVYGVTIPGARGMVIGFTRDLAWTFTNTGADVLDAYRETVDDTANPRRYKLDGTWRDLTSRIERYLDPARNVLHVDTVRYSHRGPLVHENGQWLSIRWTVLEPSDEMRGFYDAQHAHDVRGFEDAIARNYFAPAQNILVADRTGAIAIRSTGHFPVRPGDGSGLEVRDGSTERERLDRLLAGRRVSAVVRSRAGISRFRKPGADLV